MGIFNMCFLTPSPNSVQNFSFICIFFRSNSNSHILEEEDNAEFSMINPNMLDLDLEDSDDVISNNRQLATS